MYIFKIFQLSKIFRHISGPLQSSRPFIPARQAKIKPFSPRATKKQNKVSMFATWQIGFWNQELNPWHIYHFCVPRVHLHTKYIKEPKWKQGKHISGWAKWSWRKFGWKLLGIVHWTRAQCIGLAQRTGPQHPVHFNTGVVHWWGAMRWDGRAAHTDKGFKNC